jgi:hypothetical protein
MRIVPCLLVLAAWAGAAQADDSGKSLPLSTTTSLGGYDATISKPLTIAQQRARYEADQRMLRMQWNKWIGYEPLRPALPNALTNNEMNPYFFQPVRYRPVWGVWNYGSRIW